jgi:hypothetical protein
MAQESRAAADIDWKSWDGTPRVSPILLGRHGIVHVAGVRLDRDR